MAYDTTGFRWETGASMYGAYTISTGIEKAIHYTSDMTDTKYDTISDWIKDRVLDPDFANETLTKHIGDIEEKQVSANDLTVLEQAIDDYAIDSPEWIAIVMHPNMRNDKISSMINSEVLNNLLTDVGTGFLNNLLQRNKGSINMALAINNLVTYDIACSLSGVDWRTIAKNYNVNLTWAKAHASGDPSQVVREGTREAVLVWATDKMIHDDDWSHDNLVELLNLSELPVAKKKEIVLVAINNSLSMWSQYSKMISASVMTFTELWTAMSDDMKKDYIWQLLFHKNDTAMWNVIKQFLAAQTDDNLRGLVHAEILHD